MKNIDERQISIKNHNKQNLEDEEGFKMISNDFQQEEIFLG